MNESSRPGKAYQRIMFYTDFSAEADCAFEFAVDTAVANSAAVLHLLHVIPQPTAQFWKTYIYEVDGVDTKAKHDIDDKIDRVYRSRVPADIDLRVTNRIGDDCDEIVQFARSEGIDLIVIARARRTLSSELFAGALVEKVVHKAHCAVLVVPGQADGDT